jgi:4-amino-4-deoxy-L-arabinose transferase-like glycosyltransferase
MKIIRKHFIAIITICAIIFLASALRLNKLNTLPSGMTDDEIRESYSAYSIWKTGKDITRGLTLPFTFVLNNFSFSPIPIYVTAPFVGILGTMPFTARLPFALAGIGVSLLTYLIVKLLIKSTIAGVSAGICMACNVWAIQISRIAHEAVFAQLFYLWGVYVFLNNWKKHPYSSVCISMGLFFLGFNSYDATKVILIPIIITLVLYKWKEIVINKKILLIICAWLLVTFSLFGYLFITQKAGIHGSSMVVFQNTTAAAQVVELERRASDGPVLINTLYHNKLTYFAGQFFQHYLYAFSPDFLFLNQEASGVFSVWSRGNLYLIDLPLLIIGLLYCFLTRRKEFFLGITMIFIGALPSGVGTEPYTYATRSCFMLPWLAVFIATGVLLIVHIIPSKMSRYIAITILSIVYGYFVTGYLAQYYFEWPRYGAKYFSKGIKDVITLISSKIYRGNNILIYGVNDTFLLQYAFYNQINPIEIQKVFAMENPPLTYRSIQILPSCLGTKEENPRDRMDQMTLYITIPSCHSGKPDKVIYLPDNEAQWHIYEGLKTTE